MKPVVLACALASCLAGPAAFAQSADPTVALFAQSAAMSNEFEIESSQIIMQQGKNPAVRAFAKKMIEDHQAAQAQLDRAAKMAGVESQITMGAEGWKTVDDLGLMDSPKLDDTYLTAQVDAHAEAVASLSDYAASGVNPSLRAYARATLPVVLRHQRMLQQMTGIAKL